MEHERVWEELAGAGCLFVVSALEGVNDEILERLDKGHTTEQASRAIALDILDFVAEHDMIGDVDPVQ